MANTLQKLLNKFPPMLESEPEVRSSSVARSSHFSRWDFYELSKNKCITLSFIDEHPEWPWKWDAVSSNPNLTIQYIKDNIDIAGSGETKGWNWWKVVSNSGITIEDIKDAEFPAINLNAVLYNPNISMEMVDENESDWKWMRISENKCVPLDYIKRHINANWDWYCLSFNPNITIDFVLENLDKPWDWIELSGNLPLNDIEQHFDTRRTQWSWDGISLNPDINIPFIRRYIDKPFNWRLLSYNPNITIQTMEVNPDLPWDYRVVLLNPNLSMDIIDKYLENDEIKDFIYTSNTPWLWLSSNEFEYDESKYRSIVKQTKIKTIQRWWKELYYQKLLNIVDDVIWVKDLSKLVLNF